MNGNNKVYTVYGGHRGEEAEHWATFQSLERAEAYRREMLENFAGLTLAIMPDAPTEGETYADNDENWIG